MAAQDPNEMDAPWNTPADPENLHRVLQREVFAARMLACDGEVVVQIDGLPVPHHYYLINFATTGGDTHHDAHMLHWLGDQRWAKLDGHRAVIVSMRPHTLAEARDIRDRLQRGIEPPMTRNTRDRAEVVHVLLSRAISYAGVGVIQNNVDITHQDDLTREMGQLSVVAATSFSQSSK